MRHKLIGKIQTNYGIRLEILDGQTLTALLCDRDTFWIAVEFLDVPIHLAPEDPGPEWYAISRARWLGRTVQASTGGDVIELTACVRFATFNKAFRGDVSMWIDRLTPLLRNEIHPVFRRRARYEIAVATYRGLGDLRSADELIRFALGDAAISASAEELDSATILHLYAQGAWLYDATNLSADELCAYGEQLEQQIVYLLNSATIPDRRCLLLALIGRIRLRFNLHSLAARGLQRGRVKPPPPITVAEWQDLLPHLPAQRLDLLDVVDADGAILAWSEAVALLKEATLFPVQDFAETIALHAPYLNYDPRWPELVAQLDSYVASATGRQAAARLGRSRYTSLLAAGMPFAALNELHRARAALVAGDTRYEGAEALLDAAGIYRDLGLFYAAKHYALAAGAVSAHENEQDHPIVAAALILTAHCDFLAGNWICFLTWLPHVLYAHANARGAADEPGLWEDLSQLLGCVSVVAKFTHQHGNAALTDWLDRKLTTVGADLEELTSSDLTPLLPDSGNELTAASLTSQLGQAPFGDAGPTRMIRFAVKGLRWRIRARNTYDDVRAAERLAAAVQIIMAALGDDDLVLAETTVEVRVKTVRPRPNGAVIDRPPKATRRASDGAHRWEAVLTRDLGPHSVDFRLATNEVIGVATVILLSMSLLPKDPIASVLERVGKDGTLTLAVLPHIRYDRAYAFLSPDDFAEQDRQALNPVGPGGFGEVLTDEFLAPMRGPGPVFRGETPAERVPGRYGAYARTLRLSLPRLAREESFQQTISELRAEGWKDWDILMAISNLIINFRLAKSGDDFANPAVRERLLRLEPEDSSEAQVDPAMVTTDALRMHLLISAAATADALGLRPAGTLSPEEIQHVMATRYSYWEDDAPHDDPFSIL
jgi:hypothetical protein